MTAAISVMGFAAAGAASAETAEEFYKGNTIHVISPAGAESTFTVYAHIMAPFIEKYSGASVVIEPIPGGGGYQARNQMFEADPDGLFELEGVRYDWTKFVPLGRIIDESLLVFVAKDSEWQTPADAADDTFNYGESSVFFGP